MDRHQWEQMQGPELRAPSVLWPEPISSSQVVHANLHSATYRLLLSKLAVLKPD